MAGEKFFEWTESFSVGHAELDAEHRSLITAINAICGACHMRRPASSLRALLDALERETVKHLDHEDEIMRQILADGGRRLPDDIRAMTERALTGHIVEHRRVLRQLRGIKRAASPGPTEGTANLCTELKRWFVDHAVRYDSHLKAIFQAM